MSVKVLGVFTALMIVAIGLGWWLIEDARTHRITIAAGPSTGGAFEVASAIAEVTEKYHPEIDVEVVETLGSIASVELLDEGRVDLAAVLADTRTGASSRMIAFLYPDVFQLVVREDSDIHDVVDLRAKSIALPPQGAGDYLSFWFLADHYGLTPANLRALPMSAGAANWALLDGAVDAVFRVRAAGDAGLLALTQTVPTRLVPIGQAAAMRLRQPAFTVGTIPLGAYGGAPALPSADLTTVEVPRLLVAGTTLDEGLATKLTRILFERRRDLVDRTPLAGFIAPPARGGGTFIPLHEGASAYYNRDEPTFFEEQSGALALLFSITAIMTSALVRLNSRRKKRRIDQLNRSILTLGFDASDLDDPKQIRARRQRLFEIAGRAVDDAEAGHISPEGFDFFTFTWNAVDKRLAERERELE
jgi:TRAP transporter TAXI family solute receptor